MFSRRALCVFTGVAGASLAWPAMAQEVLRYGSHPRQSLQIFRGRAAGPRPLVVMVGDATRSSRLQPYARQLASRGLTAAVIDRRPARYGFGAHQGDVAQAMAALLARHDLFLNGQVAFWGQDSGADAVLLMLCDRRYLQAQAHNPDRVMGAVLINQNQPNDLTFTQSSAYGLDDPPAIYRTTRAHVADGIRFLSGLL